MTEASPPQRHVAQALSHTTQHKFGRKIRTTAREITPRRLQFQPAALEVSLPDRGDDGVSDANDEPRANTFDNKLGRAAQRSETPTNREGGPHGLVQQKALHIAAAPLQGKQRAAHNEAEDAAMGAQEDTSNDPSTPSAREKSSGDSELEAEEWCSAWCSACKKN